MTWSSRVGTIGSACSGATATPSTAANIETGRNFLNCMVIAKTGGKQRACRLNFTKGFTGRSGRTTTRDAPPCVSAQSTTLGSLASLVGGVTVLTSTGCSVSAAEATSAFM